MKIGRPEEENKLRTDRMSLNDRQNHITARRLTIMVAKAELSRTICRRLRYDIRYR